MSDATAGWLGGAPDPNDPRRCQGLRSDGTPCRHWARKGDEFCRYHGDDGATTAGDVLPAALLRDFAIPDNVDVIDALEQMSARAHRMVTYTEALVEDTPPTDPSWRYYLGLYNAALDRAKAITEAFGRFGLDTYRTSQQSELARAVAELIRVVIAKHVPVDAQPLALSMAKERLAALGSERSIEEVR